jgi:hypothetical protein
MTEPSSPAAHTTASTQELSRTMNPADVARAKGWTEGTRIVGDEGHGPTVIEITEVTRSRLFAKRISHNGVPAPDRRDTSWVLYCRDWVKV